MKATITAMYLFAGYRDTVMKNPNEQSINEDFSGGGEDSCARLLAEVATAFHATEQDPHRDGPGVWLYDVAEEVGRNIAELVIYGYENNNEQPGVRDCVEMLETATQQWADDSTTVLTGGEAVFTLTVDEQQSLTILREARSSYAADWQDYRMSKGGEADEGEGEEKWAEEYPHKAAKLARLEAIEEATFTQCS